MFIILHLANQDTINEEYYVILPLKSIAEVAGYQSLAGATLNEAVFVKRVAIGSLKYLESCLQSSERDKFQNFDTFEAFLEKFKVADLDNWNMRGLGKEGFVR